MAGDSSGRRWRRRRSCPVPAGPGPCPGGWCPDFSGAWTSSAGSPGSSGSWSFCWRCWQRMLISAESMEVISSVMETLCSQILIWYKYWCVKNFIHCSFQKAFSNLLLLLLVLLMVWHLSKELVLLLILSVYNSKIWNIEHTWCSTPNLMIPSFDDSWLKENTFILNGYIPIYENIL